MRSALFLITVASACGGSIAREGGDDDGADVDAGTETADYHCLTPIPCPPPSSGTKQTLCGRLYDLETGAQFLEAPGTQLTVACTTPTASGPCSLAIKPYDAIAFGTNPATAAPLPSGTVLLDACGRYRVTDIDVTGIGPFIALAIDDAAGSGPAGTTVPTAIATPKIAGTATKELEAWIVKQSTTQQWASTGGPALAGGVFVPMFRAHMLGTPNTNPFDPQRGVTVTKSGNPIAQYYFTADSLVRTTIDATAITTGANGTALIEGATINDSVAYSGSGGLSDPACRWEPHVGMSLPGTVFIQIFRPLSVVNATCSL